jgi:serine/threonine protein kinase
MENGQITEYVKRHPQVDRIGLVSGFVPTVTTLFIPGMLQVWDIASGLHYLHSCKIVHGDLKGVSCLVPLALDVDFDELEAECFD